MVKDGHVCRLYPDHRANQRLGLPRVMYQPLGRLGLAACKCFRRRHQSLRVAHAVYVKWLWDVDAYRVRLADGCHWLVCQPVDCPRHRVTRVHWIVLCHGGVCLRDSKEDSKPRA